MSRGRANPGRHVGAGSLRVDAARAVQKLREYQLPEPSMWILELIRAAVILGADAIRVEGDADDVRIVWSGPVPEVEDLTQLLDELVNPVSTAERRHLRLMATAVNTALGLSPRYLDVFVCSSGAAERVRFTPSILEVDEDDPLAGATGLRSLSASSVERPLGAPEDGVLVHLRRAPSFGMLATVLTGTEPAELRLVRESCNDSRVPVSIGAAVLTRERSDRDILRVPLGTSPSDFMALLRVDARSRWARPATLEACEAGVLLASHPITLPLRAFGPVPIRISVDADRLPTNASRSEVRRDEAPIAQAEAGAAKTLGSLVEHLARELGPDPARDWDDRARGELLQSTFALIASAIALGDFRTQIPALLEGPLVGLADLPLLRDAFGGPTTLRRLGSVVRVGAFIYRGAEPLPLELKRWLVDLIWIPAGDPAEELIDLSAVEDPSARIAAARESLEAFSRYSQRAVHSGQVHVEPEQWLMVPLGELSGPATRLHSDGAIAYLTELDGELCLTGGRAGGVVRYLHAGRLLVQRRLASKLSFDAVVSSDLITPNDDFTDVCRDHGADEVDRAIVGAAIRAVEDLARRLVGGKGSPGAQDRAAWLGSKEAIEERSDVRSMIRRAIVEHARVFGRQELTGPLRRAPVWPLVNAWGDAEWASIEKVLAEVGANARTLFVASAAAARRVSPGAPPGRLIVAVSKEEESALSSLCPERTTVVRYGPTDLTAQRDAARVAAELARLTGAALPFTRDSGFGAIALRDEPYSVDVYHVGRRVARRRPSGRGDGFWAFFEAPQVIPDDDFRGIKRGGVFQSFLTEERDLLRALARRAVGDPEPRLQVFEQRFRERTSSLFLGRLAAVGADQALGTKLAKRFRALPLLPVFGREDLVSLDELASLHPGPLRWVPVDETTDFDLGDYHPLRGSEELAASVATLLRKDVKDGTHQFRRRRDKAFRRGRLEQHRSQAPWTEEDPGDGLRYLDALSTSKLPRVELRLLDWQDPASMVLLIEDRLFRIVTLPHGPPVHAVVHLRVTAADAFFDELTERARNDVHALVAESVPKLLAALVEDEPAVLSKDPAARRLLDWWLERPSVDGEDEAEGTADVPEELGRAPLFETIQGDRAGALDALRRTKVYIASYVGLWIGPDDGEPPHSLDRAVLHVAEGASRPRQLELIKRLTGRRVSDVTRAAEQLQARRRVARGLVPKPTVHHFPDVAHVHDISALVGKDRKLRAALGPGEIGLIDASQSVALVFRDGVRVASVALEVRPPIVVAVESTNLSPKKKKLRGDAAISRRVQELADRLVRRLVDGDRVALLTAAQKREVASAMLTGVVLGDHDGADDLPLFQTTAGDWLSMAAVRQQHEQLGDVWLVADLTCTDLPMAPGRHAFRLSYADGARLAEAGLSPVDAAEELKLDAEVRRSQARPRVATFELDALEENHALCSEAVDLDGEPVYRGVVAPLLPGAGVHSGLRLSRDHIPLGEHEDPCDWPTRAVVDAPDIVPNRTWSGADEDNAQFLILSQTVRAVSERALERLVPVPSGALAAQRICQATCDAAGVEVAVRGALWAAPTIGPPEVRVVDADGLRELHTYGAVGRLPLRGTLHVNGPWTAGAAEKIAVHAYTAMVHGIGRGLVTAWDPLAAAHVIHALALGLVHTGEFSALANWPLGHPRPIDPVTVGGWLSGAAGVVWVLTPEQVEHAHVAFATGPGGPTEDHPWFVDDGSIAARTLRHHLGAAARPWSRLAPESRASASPSAPHALAPSSPPPESPEEPEAPESSEPPEPPESPESPELPELPEPRPATSQVAEQLGRRLRDAGISARVFPVQGKRRRLVRPGTNYVRHAPAGTTIPVELAEKHPLVRAVTEALVTGDPRGEAALDLLAARVAGEVRRAQGLSADFEVDALLALLGARLGPD